MAEVGGSEEGFKLMLSSASDIMYDFYCELCKDDGKNVEAEGYCKDCCEYLCGGCFSGHLKTRQTKLHKLLDKESMPKDKPLPYDRASKDITEVCQFHSGEPVKYFCKSHSSLGCGTCFLTSHRNCQDFESILEKSENILESNEYRELLKLLQLLGERARNVENSSRDNIREVKSCYSKVIDSINTLKQKVIATFERLEKDAMAEADKIVSEEEQKMDSLASKCSSICDSIDSLQSHFQSLQSSKRVCQIYISMKQKNKEIQKLQGDLRLDEKALVVRKFSFEPDVKFQEIVNRASTLGKLSVEDPVNSRRLAKFKTEAANEAEGLTDIGHLSILSPQAVPVQYSGCGVAEGHGKSSETASTHRKHSVQAQLNTSNLTVFEAQTAINVRHVADIDVSEHLPRNCSVTGMDVFPNGKVIIVDNGNSIVMLINTQTNQVQGQGTLIVEDNPWDVAVIDNEQAAVTLPTSGRIQLLKLSNKWRLDTIKAIIIGKGCCGVAYSNNRLLVTYAQACTQTLMYFDTNPRLDIMDLRGTVVTTIKNNKYGSQLFKNPKYVCVSRDGETIYVSDHDINQIISLSFGGAVKFVFDGWVIGYPGNLCVDHVGNVYVCNRYNGNVHILTADLNKVQITLGEKDGLYEDVTSIRHCKNQNRLYVAECNHLKVFDLS